MIVVSDTGPLNYLILIGHLDILPALYGQVVIPPAVRDELTRPGAPTRVKAVLQSPPSWLNVTDAPSCDPALVDLGTGEQQAIALAQSLHADLVLCDDKDARNAAQFRGLRVIGTLGAIQEAADRGLVDLPSAIAKLSKTNFRVTKSLIDGILNQGKRH